MDGWLECAAWKVKMINANKTVLQNLNGMYHLGDPGNCRRTILQWIIKTWGMRLQTKFILLWKGSSADHLGTRQRAVDVQLMVRYGEFIVHQQSNYQIEMGSECSADGDIWGIYCLASE